MPIYGEAKLREISRSVLPAKNAATWRSNKANINRAHRRSAKRLDPFEGNFKAVDRKAKREMKYMVTERRLSDNVASVQRWAEHKAKEFDDPVDAYYYLKKLLPDNLAGRHALNAHISGAVDGVEQPGENNNYWMWRNPVLENSTWEAALVAVIDRGHLSNFNTAIKNATAIFSHREWYDYRKYRAIPCDHHPRLLAGKHDIPDFIEEVLRRRYKDEHCEWHDAAERFLTDYC